MNENTNKTIERIAKANIGIGDKLYLISRNKVETFTVKQIIITEKHISISAENDDENKWCITFHEDNIYQYMFTNKTDAENALERGESYPS